MPLLIVAAGGTLVLALRLTFRFLRRRNEDIDKDDLFFPDDDGGRITSCRPDEPKGPGAPLRSHIASDENVRPPQQHRQYELAQPGRSEPTSVLGDENVQALPGLPNVEGSLSGRSAGPPHVADWALPVDQASISSGEARRRAASVRKVRDWDDSGGAHNWSAEPDGGRADSGSSRGGGSSGDEAERRRRGTSQLCDGSSASSSPRRPSSRAPPAPFGSAQALNPPPPPPMHVSSGGSGSRLARGDGSAGSGKDGGLCPAMLRSATETGAADGASGRLVPGSSVVATCSSGTASSVPYRSCGTGTATLTSSSSPDTSQSAELQELRIDTDSEKPRSQKQKQQPKRDQPERWEADKVGGGLVAEVVATARAEQLAEVAAAAASTPVVVGAAAAVTVAADGPGRSSHPELPAALRSSSPPCALPPPPPLPPTIVATRAPDPQSLMAIQRQVDALRLQHLQRQAQALLETLAANRTMPTAAGGAGSSASGEAARSPSPGSAWGGSAVSTAGGTAGGAEGLSTRGTPASRSISPGMGTSGSHGAQQLGSGGSWPLSPLEGLSPPLQQHTSVQLDAARRQQLDHQEQPSPGRFGSTSPASGRSASEGTVISPSRALSVGPPSSPVDGAAGAKGPGAAGGSPQDSDLEPSWQLRDASAFATVQQLLLNNQQQPSPRKASSPPEQHLQQLLGAQDTLQGRGAGPEGFVAAGDGQWPQAAIQAARMGTLQWQPQDPSTPQQQLHQAAAPGLSAAATAPRHLESAAAVVSGLSVCSAQQQALALQQHAQLQQLQMQMHAHPAAAAAGVSGRQQQHSLLEQQQQQSLLEQQQRSLLEQQQRSLLEQQQRSLLEQQQQRSLLEQQQQQRSLLEQQQQRSLLEQQQQQRSLLEQQLQEWQLMMGSMQATGTGPAPLRGMRESAAAASLPGQQPWPLGTTQQQQVSPSGSLKPLSGGAHGGGGDGGGRPANGRVASSPSQILTSQVMPGGNEQAQLQQQQPQQQQQQSQVLRQTSPPRMGGSPQLFLPASPSLQRKQQLSPQRSLSPPRLPGKQPSGLIGSPQQPQLMGFWPAWQQGASASPPPPPQQQLQQFQQVSHQQPQPQHTHRQEPLLPAAAVGGSGRGSSSPAETLLCSPPSFRHHLKETADVQQSDSAKRTQDWLNNTPTRLGTPRPQPLCDREEVASPVLRPHPPPPSSTPGILSAVSFPMTHSQPRYEQQLPSPLQDKKSNPVRFSPPSSPTLRRQDTLPSRHSCGGGSSHGSRRTSAQGSRHASVHGSRRRESSAARQRRELQELQEKMANQPPPSALGLLSARMLHAAGEVVVPAPRTPGGRAFFVPLKHELRLEMSEQANSIRSAGSETSMQSDAFGIGPLPNSFVSTEAGGPIAERSGAIHLTASYPPVPALKRRSG